jgi:ABC-type oligopeptide transport system substrate-binding subunit
MKKIAIALILVVSLSISFCACNSHNTKQNEGTTTVVSSDVKENDKDNSTTNKSGGKESPTLETVTGGKDEVVIPLDEIDDETTKSSGKEKTTKSSGKEKTTKKDSEKESTSESYELPIIPIP